MNNTKTRSEMYQDFIGMSCTEEIELEEKIIENYKKEFEDLREKYYSLQRKLEALKGFNLTKTPEGFSDEKGDPNYWTDACRDFWNETNMDTDTEELRWIVNWFDNRRNNKNDN